MHKNDVIPYVAGESEKLKRIFSKHIPFHLKTKTKLRQKTVNVKDKTTKQKLSDLVYCVQSRAGRKYTDLYIREP